MFLKREPRHFGEHLTVDGYGGDYDKLDNKKIVFECLDKLPEILKLNKIGEPVLRRAPVGHVKDCGGWSGFTIIAESHISVHTFPKKGFVSIDVYTCKNGLDKKFLKEYFIEKFDLKATEIHFIRRGTKFPVRNIY